MKAYEQLFHFWKTDGPRYQLISNKQKKRLRYLKNKLRKALIAGTHGGHEKTQRTCGNILGFTHSLWRFLEVPGVPPTNNHAERQLRPLVISKKLTFGTQSERGSRFIERIFTVAMTTKQQGRDLLAFLTQALQHYFLQEKSPSLLSP